MLFQSLFKNRLILSIALLSSTLSITIADTIFLKNEDRVTGNIVLVEKETIHIETDYAGTLAINQSAVRSFTINSPVAINESRFGHNYRASEVVYAANESATEMRIKDNFGEHEVPLDKPIIIAKIKDGESLDQATLRHSGNLEGSINLDNDSSDTKYFRLKGDYQLEHGLWRHKTAASIDRKTDDGKTKTYNYSAGYTVDRFVNPYLFWQGSIKYTHDWVEDIRENLLVGIGPGWQVWNTTRSSLSLATILNYQTITYQSREKNHSPQMALKWDYSQDLYNQKLHLLSNGSIGRSFNSDVRLDLNFTTSLAYKLNERLSLNTGYKFERIKAKHGNSKNNNIFLGIGLSF